MQNLQIFRILFFTVPLLVFAEPKVLHLTFHKGCQHEIKQLADHFSLSLETLFIPSLSKDEFDGKTIGNSRYNVTQEMADKVWNKHKTYFNEFDAVIISDTAPLARIFFREEFTKPLIIWVCNRFDFADKQTSLGTFPDKDFYEIFAEYVKKPHVKVVSYTSFERIYAHEKNVELGNEIIKPTGISNFHVHSEHKIPKTIKKEDFFFIPNYHNDTKLYRLEEFLLRRHIPCYNGRYAGPKDLVGFKGIIHIPYAWSNFALFENIQNGLIYFIPSKKYFSKLSKKKHFFFSPPFREEHLEASEWYDPKNAPLFIYFDSFSELKTKIESLDFRKKQNEIYTFAEKHRDIQLKKWKRIFHSLGIIHD